MQAIAPYGGQVTDILQHCCGDSYHEVCMQVLKSMQKLVESVGMMLFSVSKHLMAAVMPLLTHKRYKARSTLHNILCTSTDLMHQGCAELGSTASQTSQQCNSACGASFLGAS